MISEGIAKQAFMAQIFERDAKFIQDEQLKAIQAKTVERTGTLRAAVSGSGYYSISGGMLSFKIIKTLRFLDMRRTREGKPVKGSGLRVYNAIMWGRMYNETMRSLKYGFTEEVAKSIVNQLRAAGGELQEE
jgi:hypothetical protein